DRRLQRHPLIERRCGAREIDMKPKLQQASQRHGADQPDPDPRVTPRAPRKHAKIRQKTLTRHGAAQIATKRRRAALSSDRPPVRSLLLRRECRWPKVWPGMPCPRRASLLAAPRPLFLLCALRARH